MKKSFLAFVCIILASACRPGAISASLPTSNAPTQMMTASMAPTQTVGFIPTATLVPTQAPPPAEIPTPTFVPARLPVIHEEPGPIYETVLQIPVGESGIRYRGAGMTEIETTGPNGIAVLPDGSFVIGDTFDNRLLRYDAQGTRLEPVDLTALGILNVSDIVATPSELYILEISFSVAPERYRVHRMSLAGELIGSIDIPKGYHFEDGLIGLASGEGQILLEMGSGMVWYYQMEGPHAELTGEFYGLPAYGRLYQTHYEIPCGGPAAITVGDMKFETGKTLGSGLGMLAANPDGSFYAWRVDAVADQPVFMSDQTIHLISAGGEQIGVTRYPLAEWYFHLLEYLAVGPDGEVYALITREKSVDILRLNFYQSLEPIQSGAAAPEITSGPLDAVPDSQCECEKVQHLLPDSMEAQQIVQEVVDNYREDWPTEHLDFEQLWSVDRLEEYALIQGLVTPEASEVIVAQHTVRGYVMAARYTVSKRGPTSAILPDYLRAKAPEAPWELLFCLDLSRYLEE